MLSNSFIISDKTGFMAEQFIWSNKLDSMRFIRVKTSQISFTFFLHHAKYPLWYPGLGGGLCISHQNYSWLLDFNLQDDIKYKQTCSQQNLMFGHLIRIREADQAKSFFTTPSYMWYSRYVHVHPYTVNQVSWN